MDERHCEMQREHLLERIDRNETRLNKEVGKMLDKKKVGKINEQ